MQGAAAVGRLLEEIGVVYKTACHCGCGVDGVLTQIQLIDALIKRGALPESARVVVPERPEPRIYQIRELDGPSRQRSISGLRNEGVRFRATGRLCSGVVHAVGIAIASSRDGRGAPITYRLRGLALSVGSPKDTRGRQQ